jgi:hypothetical protein
MKLEEVERIVAELAPSDQRKLAEGIWGQLKASEHEAECSEARRTRRLAFIASCDEFAGPDGELDAAEDLRLIRAQRIADLDR